MLRTEPATLSLPGPCGAAGFHPDATPYRLQQPFRLRRSVAPLPALHASRREGNRRDVRGNDVSPHAAFRPCGWPLLLCSGLFSPFEFLLRVLITPQSSWLSWVNAYARSRKLFAHKNFSRPPRTSASAGGVYAPAAKDLKRVKFYPRDSFSRYPQNVKTAAPETQRVMFF